MYTERWSRLTLELPWTGIRSPAAQTMVHAMPLQEPQALRVVRTQESRGKIPRRSAILQAHTTEVSREIPPAFRALDPLEGEANIGIGVAFPVARDSGALAHQRVDLVQQQDARSHPVHIAYGGKVPFGLADAHGDACRKFDAVSV